MDLNEEKPKAKYNCSQGVLYLGLNRTWDSFKEHQPDFLAENTKYVLGYEVPRFAEIKAASDLPDGQARYAEAEAKRVILVGIAAQGIGKWNSLDGYIHGAFDSNNTYKPRVEEAGKKYYEKAVNENWESVDRLFVSTENFLTKFETELTTNGGMPANFKANFITLIGTYKATFRLFKKAEKLAETETADKIIANNLIYETGRKMMEDGKHIFRDNFALREEFVWESIISHFSMHRSHDEPIPPEPPVE